MDFVKEIYVNDLEKIQDLTIPIYLDKVKYYGKRFWDTSTLLGFDWLFLDEENTYYTENIKQDVAPLMKNDEGQTIFFQATFNQSIKIVETQWSIDSIDLILGFIGGMAGLIWSILGFVLGSYQNFAFESSMINNFYGVSKMNPEADSPDTDELATNEVKRSLANKKRYMYTYREYIGTKIMSMSCFAKCFKNRLDAERIQRFERHAETTDRLEQELDFVRLIRNLRVFEFISRLLLKKYQRVLVQSFRKYQTKPTSTDRLTLEGHHLSKSLNDNDSSSQKSQAQDQG